MLRVGTRRLLPVPMAGARRLAISQRAASSILSARWCARRRYICTGRCTSRHPVIRIGRLPLSHCSGGHMIMLAKVRALPVRSPWLNSSAGFSRIDSVPEGQPKIAQRFIAGIKAVLVWMWHWCGIGVWHCVALHCVALGSYLHIKHFLFNPIHEQARIVNLDNWLAPTKC